MHINIIILGFLGVFERLSFIPSKVYTVEK